MGRYTGGPVLGEPSRYPSAKSSRAALASADRPPWRASASSTATWRSFRREASVASSPVTGMVQAYLGLAGAPPVTQHVTMSAEGRPHSSTGD